MKHVAVDLGAESGRIIVGDVRSIDVVTRFPNNPVLVGGSLHWDILGLYREILRGLREAFARYPGEISSIGIDSWGVDFGLLDAAGELIGNPYHYRDARTDGIQEALFESVPKREIYDATGVQFMQINTICQLVAFAKRHPGLYRAASHFLHIPDLLNYWLTGVMANEYSMATTSQLFDPSKREWAVGLMGRVGLRPELFKEPVMPGTVIGPLLPAAAREIGAAAGIVVVAPATHDTASAVAAVPAGDGEYAYISSGTWSLFGVVSKKPVITERSFRYNFTNEGSADGGICLLKNIMGLWIVQECKRAWDAEGKEFSYVELVEMAEKRGRGRFSMDPDDARFLKPSLTGDSMPERIRQWCRETGQPAPEGAGETVRGILESLADAYKRTLAKIEEITGRRIAEIYIIGGGSNNALLCRLASVALGIPVYAGPVEATAIGNIMVQQAALGEIASIEEGRRIVREGYEVRKYLPLQSA